MAAAAHGPLLPQRPSALTSRYNVSTVEDGFGKGMVRVARQGRAGAEKLFSVKRACPSCGRSFADLDPRLFSFNSPHGWCETCYGTGVELEDFDADQTGEENWWIDGDGGDVCCHACHGHRLRQALPAPSRAALPHRTHRARRCQA